MELSSGSRCRVELRTIKFCPAVSVISCITSRITWSTQTLRRQLLNLFDMCTACPPCITEDDNPEVLGIGVNVVRSLCGEGVPDGNPAVRAALWKIVLGYLPVDVFIWDSSLSRSRELYKGFAEDLLTAKQEPIVAADDLMDTLDQITKDVVCKRADMDFSTKSIQEVNEISRNGEERKDQAREGRCQIEEHETAVGDQFQDNKAVAEPKTLPGGLQRPESSSVVGHNLSPDDIDVLHPLRHSDDLARILLVYARLNPGIRYVQEMNELCAPLHFLLSNDPLQCSQAEADAFFCFNLVMAEKRDAAVKPLDNTVNGMFGRIKELSELLQGKDEEVWRHLEEEQVSPADHYSVRWLTLMLTQELDMLDILHVWNSLSFEDFQYDSGDSLEKMNLTLFAQDHHLHLHLPPSFVVARMPWLDIIITLAHFDWPVAKQGFDLWCCTLCTSLIYIRI